MLHLSLDPRSSSRTCSPKELDLIAAAQRGDISAFNQLVRAHQELAYSLAFHILGSTDAAERVTASAFEGAYRQIRHWNGDAFKIWLLRIVMRHCKQAASSRVNAANSFRQSPLEIGLAVLSLEDRTICVLADVLGLNDEDIAQITNTSIGSIRATRGRARRQIRDVLQINGKVSSKHTW